MARRLGEMLLSEGLITDAQLNKALVQQKKQGGKLGSHLVRMGYLTEDQLLMGVSRQLGVERINISTINIEPEIIKLISPEMAYKYKVIPISREGKKGLAVVMADPTDMLAVDDIRFRTGFDITTKVASESAIEKALNQYYTSPEPLTKLPAISEREVRLDILEPLAEVQAQSPDDPPAVNLLNSILLDAIEKRADSLHIEPYERRIRIRMRIDGILHEQFSPPIRMRSTILSRLESIFNFNRTGRRLLQTGHAIVKINGHLVRLMAHMYPTLYGEEVIIRIWDQSNLNLDISQLGLQRKAFNDLSKALNGHYGIVIFAGPHKSEKIITYYSILNTANSIHQNVISLENPVEYNIEGINQIEIDPKGNLAPQQVLEFLMDEDVDVIGISDISETDIFQKLLRLATHARVYGIIGSRGTADALTQLMSSEIDVNLLADTLKCVVSQTSIRKICEHCKTPIEISPEKFTRFGLDPQKLGGRTYYTGAGCDRCFGTGYRYRQPVFEVMPITTELAEMIVNRVPSHEIRTEAIKNGVRPMKEDAFLKFARGVTTLDEIAKEFA